MCKRVPRHTTAKRAWRCRGSNPGPFTCKANALPLSYNPKDANVRLKVLPDFTYRTFIGLFTLVVQYIILFSIFGVPYIILLYSLLIILILTIEKAYGKRVKLARSPGLVRESVTPVIIF